MNIVCAVIPAGIETAGGCYVGERPALGCVAYTINSICTSAVTKVPASGEAIGKSAKF